MHLGHLGSSSESITYMRHLGQPARTMDVASGLLEHDDTQELGGEVDDVDPFGEFSPSLTALEVLPLRGGGDKFSFRSSFGLFPLFLLILL